MKKNGKRLLITGSILVAAFVAWTLLIQGMDVQSVGVNGTDVGFATFNSWFHKLTGVHMWIYVVTDWLGLVPIGVCMVFGGIGFTQLVKRRSLFSVDCDIIILGIYYIVVIAAYLVFEMIPINYRPILIEGVMEVSYPSSTSLLVLCVMPTLTEQMNRRLKSVAVKRAVGIITITFSVVMVLGRLISGVHWFTDIVGGALLSAGLFCIYKAVVMLAGKEENE